MAPTKFKVLLTEPKLFDEFSIQVPKYWEISRFHSSSQARFEEHLKLNKYNIIFFKIGLYFTNNIFESQSGHLTVLATPTTGLDHIDLVSAVKSGVTVISLKGDTEFLSSITTTAEHAWMLLLACARNLTALTVRVAEMRWHREDLEIHQLAGASLGIIGHGRLGKILSEYGKIFRMKVLLYDHIYSNSLDSKPENSVSFDTLLHESDYIIIAASYTKGNKPILDETSFDKMKRGVVLINIARGELIEDQYLIRSIKCGIVKAAGLDVITGDSSWSSTDENLPEYFRYYASSNRVILTPHVGGYAKEALSITRRHIVELVLSHINH